MRFCQHLAEQNGEQMGAAKIAIELAHECEPGTGPQRRAAGQLRPDVESGYRAGIENISRDRRQRKTE